VNTLVSGHQRSISVVKEPAHFEKDVMYKAAMSFEKQMDEPDRAHVLSTR